MIREFFILNVLFALIPLSLRGQDLLRELTQKQNDARDIVLATFKGTRLINGHSVETQGGGELIFLISHRFGRINSGIYNFFGLDAATIRLGLEYGLTDRFNVGIGRSSWEKVIDGFLKYKLIQQRKRNTPITITLFSSISVNTTRNSDSNQTILLDTRLDFVHQMLIAHKLNANISFQLMPTLVHRNLVATANTQNDLYLIGVGGRYKITKRIAINIEYYHRLNAYYEDSYQNSTAIGFDIETGGHVFQLHFTNSRAMIEEGFLTETTGDFFSGDIHFGFNISRTFQIK